VISSAVRVASLLTLVIALAAGSRLAPAAAQIGSDRYAAIVVEARSGAVLMSSDPDETRYPASLTKMMTVYMALEALREGRIQRWTPVPVSASAATMPPSRLGLTPGMALTVEEAILALVTKSANDAAAALGELLGGGSEQRFAQIMTLRARSLGMTRTTFRNASGLPDLDQVTTARDMALLGRRLIQDFPRDYAYFSTAQFAFRGRMHWNHNRLLQQYDGADGIKTGYVNDSGFNLVASAERDGVRLIGAVFGGRTARERDRHMMAILDQGFMSAGVAPRDPPIAIVRPLTGVLTSARAATPAARARTGRATVLAAARRPSVTPPVRQASASVSRRPVRSASAASPARPAAVQSSRTVQARRSVPTITSSARAGEARATRILPPPPPRPPMLRLTSSTRPATAAVRVEQGDGGRHAARPAAPSRNRR
jgi:D-alanyl-D-alanine carboxypeptidase